MPVRFILGRAGTGKTYYCLNAIREELKRSQTGSPLLFLVPEQATFEMSRVLLEGSDLPGYSRAHVLSFRRLAYHVFTEVGGPALPPAGNLARQMLIARVLETKEGELQVFKRSARRPGLAARLATLITEMHRYRWSREEMETRIASVEGGSLLALKLSDILLIYDAYHQRLLKDYSDPDDFLDLLADKLPQSSFARGAHVWIDGFAGLTPQESLAAEKLLEQSSEADIALCLDPAEAESLARSKKGPAPTRLFHQTEETYLTLRAVCKRLDKKTETLALPREGQTTRFHAAPAIAHLEQELFRPIPGTYTATPDEIELIEASNARAEVDAAAREILRLCKEQNYRFRDIAVILRDFAGYHELISARFGDYQIPYFIDRRREVTHHPLVELTRSAVGVAAGNWPYEAVIHYLKSDLAPVSREEADMLENYALEHGISGTRWYAEEDWALRRSRDLEETVRLHDDETCLEDINRCRRAAVAALRAFHEKVSDTDHTTRDITAALFAFLQDLKVTDRIEAWREEAEASGDLDAAAEHAQIWNNLVDLLGELVCVLGDEKMSIEEYVDVLEAGLSGMTLGLVPPGLDQVLVGSIDRSRHPDLRAALVIGVGEGVLPKVPSEDAVFTDRDRQELTEAGLRIGPTSEEKLYHERFLGYIAFTRPKERLWISYPASDASGRKRNPSIFINHLRRCMPKLTPRRVGAAETHDTFEHVWTATGLASAFALAIQRDQGDLPGWRQAYNQILVSATNGKERIQRVLAGLSYSNAAKKLPKKIIERVYPGNTMTGSASQFETFRACPFRYFARYVLQLEPREEFVLSALDMGSLYHAVLSHVVHALIEEGVDLVDLDEAEAAKRVDEAVDEIAPRLKSEILLSDGRSEYIRSDTARILRDLMAVMLSQAAATDFKPAACELGFGGEQDPLPAVQIDVDKTYRVKIKGRIDRVDLAPEAKAQLARVIDYKSTSRRVPLYELVQGLHLQLPTYLIALQAHGRKALGAPLKPVGGFLQPIRAGSAQEMSLTRADGVPPLREQAEQYRARGFFGEEFIGRLDHSVGPKERSRHIALYINKDGEVSVQGDHVRAGHIDRLLELAERHIKDIAQHVLQGDTQIAPYRIGTTTPCSYCDYRGVCRFDATHNHYRSIQTQSRQEMLEMLSSDTGTVWETSVARNK